MHTSEAEVFLCVSVLLSNEATPRRELEISYHIQVWKKIYIIRVLLFIKSIWLEPD